MKGIDQTGSVFERFGVTLSGIVQGKELPDDVRETMINIIRNYASTLEGRRGATRQNLIEQSKQMGIEWSPITDEKTTKTDKSFTDSEYEAKKKRLLGQ